ncbi:MAG TPA: hypothetical protein VGR31_13475 [Planctomycetota bacterium]|jgi:hypothetical protein|nr:hypothetical protein [Planctomycetota bacterium]
MKNGSKNSNRRGSALLATTILIAALAVLLLSMLATGLSGRRAVVGQDDELRLTGVVESAGNLSAQYLWAGYLRSQGGAAGDLASFRRYLDGAGYLDQGPGAPPPADQGVDILDQVGLPTGRGGTSELDRTRVESLRVFRRDEGEATRLFVSAVADTNRGGNGSHPLPARAVQVAYTVEPAPFAGFDYGILSKNINCVFCHTVVDSARRAYDNDPAHFGTFDKVKVGSLETLMLRERPGGGISDQAADSLIAGTMYVRGTATNQHGDPISNSGWASLTANSCSFDALAHLLQDASGGLIPTDFVPAQQPLQPGENLYLHYPTQYAQQPDGLLPTDFPPPFPDDGGVSGVGGGNRTVDPGEFAAVARDAHGAIDSGIVYLSAPGTVIGSQAQFDRAIAVGNQTSLGSVTTGNVILSGTQSNPIVIDGTIAIDGDVIIQGWIKGTGSILASGNVYVPGDLHYLDGHTYLPGDPPGSPSGPVTFGVAQDGTANTLGLAAGGNVLIGDYLRPSSSLNPGPYDIVSGDPAGTWNFALAEVSIFNRGEWAHTQPMLPGPGDDPANPATWTVHNPGYIPGYVPRYYQFGPGDPVPIFNLADLSFDLETGTWLGKEVPLGWDTNDLTIANPADHSNPILYDPATGEPRATILQVTSDGGWAPDAFQKHAMEAFKAERPEGEPMKLDGLYYTNNAIFGMVARDDRMMGKLLVNGSLVCADLGLLAPGNRMSGGNDRVPGSPYSVGLRLNYDERTRTMLNVRNPNQVTIHKALWMPTATP